MECNFLVWRVLSLWVDASWYSMCQSIEVFELETRVALVKKNKPTKWNALCLIQLINYVFILRNVCKRMFRIHDTCNPGCNLGNYHFVHPLSLLAISSACINRGSSLRLPRFSLRFFHSFKAFVHRVALYSDCINQNHSLADQRVTESADSHSCVLLILYFMWC